MLNVLCLLYRIGQCWIAFVPGGSWCYWVFSFPFVQQISVLFLCYICVLNVVVLFL